MTRRRGGSTLVEVIVSAAVGLMILAGVASLLVRGLDSWAVGQRRAAAQQSGLLAMHLLTCDLQLSDIKSVTLYPTAAMPDVRGISFLSGERDGGMQHDEYGEILWQKFVVYYLDASTGTLRRREEPVGTPELPDFPLGQPVKDPDPLTITSFQPAPDDRVIARGVRDVRFQMPLAGGNPVTLGLVTGDYTHTSSLTSSVVMENGFLKANPIGRINLSRVYRLPPALPPLRP